MGLGIYSAPNEDSLLSVQNPFAITFDGRRGGAQDKRIYLHNSSTTLWYQNITLKVIDLVGTSIVDGSQDGWYWKLMEKDIPPTVEEWNQVAAGNTLSFNVNLGSSVLSDTVTYLPVWVRVQIPRGQSIQTITDVVFRLDAQENIL